MRKVLKNKKAHTIIILFLQKVWKDEYGNLYILYLRSKNKRTCLNEYLSVT